MPDEKKKEFAGSFPVTAVLLESTRTLLVDAPPLRVTDEVPPLVEPRIATLVTETVSAVAPPVTVSPPLALSAAEIVAEAQESAPEIVAEAALRSAVRVAEAALRAP